jgi:hypothetical protein
MTIEDAKACHDLAERIVIRQAQVLAPELAYPGHAALVGRAVEQLLDQQ